MAGLLSWFSVWDNFQAFSPFQVFTPSQPTLGQLKLNDHYGNFVAIFLLFFAY
jgi:hypothetical protein